VALRTPADQVGSVTGVVGAAGGLGGFLPPLVMGSLYGAYESYAIGLALLAVVAAVALGFTLTTVRASAEGGERKAHTGSRSGHGTTAGTTA
jgi:NNP family nitrate/nitrite transporter-like MFS transporter